MGSEKLTSAVKQDGCSQLRQSSSAAELEAHLS